MAIPPLQASQSALESSDAFDRRALEMLHRLGGDKLVAEMVSLFVQQGAERVSAARAGLQLRNAENVRAAAHALKSSAGQLGAMRLQRMCAELEAAVRQSLVGTNERLDAIEAEFSRASRWLQDEARST